MISPTHIRSILKKLPLWGLGGFLLLLTTIASAANYRFQTLDTRNGLSNNSVTSLLVDSRGFLWIGTEMGLNRYDGYTIRNIYNFNGQRNNPVMNVVDIQEDALGNLWLENDASIARYDYHTNHFDLENTGYLESLGFRMSKDYILHTDSEGSLWIVSNGLIQYKKLKQHGKNEVKRWRVNITLDKQHSWFVQESNDGLYLTDGTCLMRFSSSNGRLQRILLPQHLTPDTGYLRLYVDFDGVLWVYSLISDHICYKTRNDLLPATPFLLPGASAGSKGQQPASASNAIRKIFDDGQGQLWIATDHQGVYVYKKQERQFMHLQHEENNATSPSSDNVTTILCDRHGTVWMGHLNSGISYCTPRNSLFSHYGSHLGDISTMLYDSTGNLWLGTDGNGLFVQHADGNYEKTALPNITISSLLEDHNGTIWVGTYNNGLFRMKGTQQYTLFTKENGHLPHNSVLQMTEDKNGNIWYTSVFEPMARFNTKTEHASVYLNKGQNVTGMSFASDDRGTMYCATYYGLWVYDTNTGRARFCFGNKRGTQNFLQYFIGPMFYENHASTLWMGHKAGITVWDQKCDTLYYIDNTNGLRNANIKAIAPDQHGNMWVSTDRGVSCIKTIKDGKSFSIRNFSTDEGLQTEFFNAYASAHSHDGNILFGGRGGYTAITHHPSPNTQPTTYFTEIAIGDSILTPATIPATVTDASASVPRTSSVALHHDDRLLRITFFTGNLVSANRVTYAYRLIGLSDKWIYTEDNYASFFSLAPGNYTLEVKASDEDGEWGEVSRLSISVAPPFYLSIWMISVYVILLAVAFFLAFRYLRQRQKNSMEEEKRKIEQGQQVQLSEMKLRFFTNISHDLRTPLTLIISPLQSIMKEPLTDDIKNRLAVIDKNAQLLLSQVNTLLDFRRLDVGAENLKTQSIDIVHSINETYLSFKDYASERNIALRYTSSVSQLFIDVDADKISKIMYNLLSNAFKFTPDGGSITVSLDNDGNQVTLSVADTGIGISDTDKQNIFQRFYQVRTDDPKAGSGIGLHIVSEYVRMHNGDITVTDNTPRGTIFTITIPIPHAKAPNATTVPDAATIPDAFASAPSSHPQTAAPEEPFTVLIVDDNHDMCNFIADSLRDTYDVLLAADGEEALQQLAQHDVTLVVSDIMMPRIDGLELCHRIKTDIRWSHIPVILLTAKSADTSLIQGLQQGADDYITKPFNIQHLRLRIQKFIEWTRQSHQTFQQRIEVEPSEITITPLDQQFVSDAIAIVEANLTDSDFNVDAMGRQLGMSRTTLYKKLNSITGKGPHEFIRTIRLKRAYRLLEKSQMQISEIAYATGYSSPKRFSENFKAEYGVTPSEFAKSRKTT